MLNASLHTHAQTFSLCCIVSVRGGKKIDRHKQRGRFNLGSLVNIHKRTHTHTHTLSAQREFQSNDVHQCSQQHLLAACLYGGSYCQWCLQAKAGSYQLQFKGQLISCTPGGVVTVLPATEPSAAAAGKRARILKCHTVFRFSFITSFYFSIFVTFLFLFKKKSLDFL